MKKKKTIVIGFIASCLIAALFISIATSKKIKEKEEPVTVINSNYSWSTGEIIFDDTNDYEKFTNNTVGYKQFTLAVRVISLGGGITIEVNFQVGSLRFLHDVITFSGAFVDERILKTYDIAVPEIEIEVMQQSGSWQVWLDCYVIA